MASKPLLSAPPVQRIHRRIAGIRIKFLAIRYLRDELTTSIDLRTCSMEDIVREAWALRTSFDLKNVAYGRIHWGNERDIRTEPFPYYYFLAGIVKLTRAERVVEIGTHQGGSARALA